MPGIGRYHNGMIQFCQIIYEPAGKATACRKHERALESLKRIENFAVPDHDLLIIPKGAGFIYAVVVIFAMGHDRGKENHNRHDGPREIKTRLPGLLRPIVDTHVESPFSYWVDLFCG